MDEEEDFALDAAFRAGGFAGLAASNLMDIDDPVYGFFEAVRRHTQGSLRQAEPEEDSPAVIVMSNRPRLDAMELSNQAKRLHDLDLRKPADWQGKLIMSSTAGTTGWAFPLPGNQDDALTFLEERGFGDLPVVVVYPEQRVLTCYQLGANSDLSLRLELPKDGRPVNLENIFAVLEQATEKSLKIPANAVGLWKAADHYQPKEEAERQIQWIVTAWLSASFDPVLVLVEQNSTVGRIDILFQDQTAAPPDPMHPAVLELKVLKSKTHTGAQFSEYANKISVVRGIIQSVAYRNAKAARFGALACFDMRKDKDDILKIQICEGAKEKYYGDDDTLAAQVFPLYGKPADAQKAAAGG
jgi:hypothetical protein